MISLTRRITLGTVALTAVVVGAAGVLVWTASYWHAIHAMDLELAEHSQRFRMIADDPTLRLGNPGDPDQRPPWMRKPPPMGRMMLQIREMDSGREILHVNTGETDLLALLKSGHPDQPAWVSLPDGERLRAVWLTTRPTDGPSLQAAIGIIAAPTLQELARLGVVLFAVWLTASSLAVLAAWRLHRSVIGPIRRLASAIQSIHPGSTRCGIADEIPSEMTPITHTLDDLLERQAALLAREKSTIANIAHELRSPISGLRTTLEVAAMCPSSADPDLANRCLPTVIAMQSIVVNLLTLARLEAGQEQVAMEVVDLGELVTSNWSALDPIVQERGQRLDSPAISGRVCTCRHKAAMIIGNLLNNAITHAPANSIIQIHHDEEDGCHWLRIINVIDGIPPDPARIFDPFWRGDASRTSPLHCGLGLALVQRLATLIGAQVRAEVLGDRFIAHLGLPVAT